MEKRDVIEFLDWLTTDGNQIQFAIVNPTLTPNQKEEWYRGREIIQNGDMERWGKNWLEATGRPANLLPSLIPAALQAVLENGKVYPRSY